MDPNAPAPAPQVTHPRDERLCLTYPTSVTQDIYSFLQLTIVVGMEKTLTFTPHGLNAFPFVMSEFHNFLAGKKPSVEWLEFVTSKDMSKLIAIHVNRSAKAFRSILHYWQGVPLNHIIDESDPNTASLIWNESIHYQNYDLAQNIFLLTRFAWKHSILPDTLPFHSSAMKDAPVPIMSSLVLKNYFPAVIFSTAGSIKHSSNGVLLEREINYSDRHWLSGKDVTPWISSEPVVMRDPFRSVGYPVQIVMRNTVFRSSRSPDLIEPVRCALAQLHAQLVLCCVTDGGAAALGETVCIGFADGELKLKATDETNEIATATFTKTCSFEVPIDRRTHDKLECSMTVFVSLQVPSVAPFQKLIEPSTRSKVFSAEEIAEGQNAVDEIPLHVTGTLCNVDAAWINGKRTSLSSEALCYIANKAKWSQQPIGLCHTC